MDIHIALSSLNKEGVEDEPKSEMLKNERSGSSSSGVYSSGGSVGSDSPDYNSARKEDMTGMKNIRSNEYVSTLTIGIENKDNVAKI